jgi:hypothetical protein
VAARLRSTRFFVAILKILRHLSWTARWDLTWLKDVSEAGESRGAANRSRASDGRAYHDGTFCEVTTDWDRGESGNSEIINGRCAECRIRIFVSSHIFAIIPSKCPQEGPVFSRPRHVDDSGR